MKETIDFDFTDRYKVLGIPYPDPNTMCKGHCQGIGYFPHYNVWADFKKDLNNSLRLYCDPVEPSYDYTITPLWEKKHKKAHTLRSAIKYAWMFKNIKILWQQFKCDGWHFIECLDCKGTGKRI